MQLPIFGVSLIYDTVFTTTAQNFFRSNKTVYGFKCVFHFPVFPHKNRDSTRQYNSRKESPSKDESIHDNATEFDAMQLTQSGYTGLTRQS